METQTLNFPATDDSGQSATSVQPLDTVIIDFEGRWTGSTSADQFEAERSHFFHPKKVPPSSLSSLSSSSEIGSEEIPVGEAVTAAAGGGGTVHANEDPIFHAAHDWMVVIGEKDVIPCLEMAVRFMSVGETALVWSHSKYAYGSSQRQNGAYQLPPNSNVYYLVHVREIIAHPNTNVAGQVAAARMKKMIGNDCYENEWFTGGIGKIRAKQHYQRGAEMMLYLLQSKSGTDTEEQETAAAPLPPSTTSIHPVTKTDDEMLQEARVIMLDCLNNIVALHLRDREFKLAKEAAVKVLVHDRHNFKGLIRAAKAALMDPASSYEEVELAMDAAAAALPTRHSERERMELEKLRIDHQRKKQEYQKKTKQMLSTMGKAIGKDSAMMRTGTPTLGRDIVTGEYLSQESPSAGMPVENVPTSSRLETMDDAILGDPIDNSTELSHGLRVAATSVWNMLDRKLVFQVVGQILFPVLLVQLITFFRNR